MENILEIFLHLDVHLNEWIIFFGPSIYVILFFIIFCETGLVITPFLPGDSLLFALGAVAAMENSALSLFTLILILIVAAILGDTVNYAVGRRIGPKVFRSDSSRLFNKEYLLSTQHFYEKHGGKTIIFARFLPIIRTFAPFVAGIGKMAYNRFVLFNITGGIFWVLSFLLAGYYFGNIPAVKRNFEFVILGIIVVSCLPMAIRLVRTQLTKFS